MASVDNKHLDSLGLSAEERTALEAEEKRRVAALADEIAARYDVSRLGKLSVAAAGKAEKLDPETRRRMEARLGGSFGDVRVVRGPFADRVTRRHGADAVTIGATGMILLRDTPRTNPRSPEGRAILAHELTHVRQAKKGLHFAHQQGSSGAAHEQEAEHVERGVLREERHKQSAGRAGHSEAFVERVIDRVIEMVPERDRELVDRSGFDDR